MDGAKHKLAGKWQVCVASAFPILSFQHPGPLLMRQSFSQADTQTSDDFFKLSKELQDKLDQAIKDVKIKGLLYALKTLLDIMGFLLELIKYRRTR